MATLNPVADVATLDTNTGILTFTGVDFAINDVVLYDVDGAEIAIWSSVGLKRQDETAATGPGGTVDLSNYYTKAQDDAKLLAQLTALLGGAGSDSDTLAKLAALIATQRQRIDNVLAGAQADIDTFIEVYNRFLAGDTVAAALQTSINNLTTLVQGIVVDVAGNQTNKAPSNRLLTAGLAGKVNSYGVLTSAGVYRAYDTVDLATTAAANDATLFIRGIIGGVFFRKNTRIEATGATLTDAVILGDSAGTTAHLQEASGFRGSAAVYVDANNGPAANSTTLRNLELTGPAGIVIRQEYAQAQGLRDRVTITKSLLSASSPHWNTGQYGTTSIFAFTGSSAAGNRPVDIYLEDFPIAAAQDIFSGTLPDGSKIYLRGTTTLTPGSGGVVQRVSRVVTVTSNGNPTQQTIPFTDAELIVDERTASGGAAFTTYDLLALTSAQMDAVMALAYDDNNDADPAASPSWSKPGMWFRALDANGDAWEYKCGRQSYIPGVSGRGQGPCWGRITRIKP
jgi:hypothetical protein